MNFSASCHCGNIRLIGDALPAHVTACNCSICHRLGALWAKMPPDTVRIEVGAEGIGSYRHGDRALAFLHCPGCGCATHYLTEPGIEPATLALNARMLPREVLASLRVRHFDGADTWRYVDD